jgi:hypothetical protein
MAQFNRARDYNPVTSAITSTDPLLAITGQLYAYASDIPCAGPIRPDSPASAAVFAVLQAFHPAQKGRSGITMATGGRSS